MRAARYWFDSSAADTWRQREAALLEQVLPTLTGYRGMQLGATNIAAMTATTMATLRYWHADTRPAGQVDLCVDDRHLPLASDSVDALVLIHALELSRAPDTLLRECERVLSRRGQMLMLVFKPISPWMQMQRLRPGARQFRPEHRPPTSGHLTRRVRQLGLEATELWHYGPGLPAMPVMTTSSTRKVMAMTMACLMPAYAMVARRHDIRPIHETRRRLFRRVPRRKGLATN